MAWIAVVTAATGINDSHISAVAGELPTTAVLNRLAPNAVEFQVEAAAIPKISDIPGIDINVLPTSNRRKSLLIADMDSTIIPVECIDELADFAGVKAEVASVTEAAMRGELDFGQALDTRVALLKGITRAQIEECRQRRVSLNPGADILVKTMNNLGAFTALVSGGFTVFTDPVAAKAGFQLNRANTLLFDGEELSGKVAKPICDADTKLRTLNEIIQDRGISSDDVIAVGDGANDAPMVAKAGLGVAFHAKPKLKEVAKARLDHSDLTALLALQGIPEAQWVSG